MRGRCAGCGQEVVVERDDRGGLRGGACGCGRSGEFPAPRIGPGKAPGRPVGAHEAPDARMPPRGGPRRRAGGGGGGGGLPGGGAKPWSNAEPTGCSCGRKRHGSKMEARVCLAVRSEVEPKGGWVQQQQRFPLPNLPPSPDRPRPSLRPDFTWFLPDGSWGCGEAKSRTRVSRDWPSRAAAFRAFYGLERLVERDR